MGCRAIVSYRYVDLAEIDPGHLAWREGAVGPRLSVGGNRLVFGSRPVDDHRLWQVPRPHEEQRGVPFAVGQAQSLVCKRHGGALVLNPEVPLALAGRFGVGVALAVFPPRFERREESLDAGIGGVSVELVGGMPAHEVFRTQPDTLVPDGAPERHERLAIEPPTLTSKRIQLFICADLDPAYPIVTHIPLFFFSAPKTVRFSQKCEG